MSDPQFTCADKIEEQAADWLQRRHFWNWTDGDQAALDGWLAESPAHLVAYLRLESALGRTGRLAALRAPDGEQAAAPQSGAMQPVLLRMAAVLAILVLTGAGAAFLFSRSQERTYVTPVGGHEIVSFADGSKIELNTDTVLRARMTTQERVVWLDRGEAFFRVKHDPAHPFVVMVGDRRVTDLGTQFLVRREQHRLEVAVLQGRVWFDRPDKQTLAQAAFLTPGDVATIKSGQMTVAKTNVHLLDSELAWRQGVLVFRHTPLAEAARELNRYNRTKIVIDDATAAGMTMNGSFPATSVSTFIEAARDVFGLHVEDRGKEIVISR
jgi:transmembrane sensor